MYKAYRFSSDKLSYNNIEKVYASSWSNYDYIVKKNRFFVSAMALKETDLILFMLANPCLNLMSKII